LIALNKVNGDAALVGLGVQLVDGIIIDVWIVMP
jgi:hypothetical protein